MKKNKKVWMFVIIALINLIVILCFIFLTKKIRNSDELKIGQVKFLPTHSIYYL